MGQGSYGMLVYGVTFPRASVKRLDEIQSEAFQDAVGDFKSPKGTSLQCSLLEESSYLGFVIASSLDEEGTVVVIQECGISPTLKKAWERLVDHLKDKGLPLGDPGLLFVTDYD